jgi:glycosyltransferase involved in cell wall biosynthesis
MKIIINAGSTYDGGAVQVALSFIQECRKIHDNVYHVILGLKLSQYIVEKDYPSNFFFYYLDYRPANRIVSIKPRTAFFKALETKIKPDVVFTTSGPAYWSPQAPHLCGFNIPQSVYRESKYFKTLSLKSQIKWKIDKYLRRYFFRKEASHFVVQTEDVNSRLKSWFRTENVYTVSNTCHSVYFTQKRVANKLPQARTGEYRFLTFSTFRGHKNFTLIKNVVDQFDDQQKLNVRFVVTIPHDDYSQFFGDSYKPYIYNVGPIRVDEGPSLYQECDAVFQPTVLECFSATYPEAMAMKLPILTSDLSFAKSICGNAAIYFDPYSAKNASDSINMIMESSELRNDLVKKGEKRLVEFGDGYKRAKNYLACCALILNKN